MLPNPAEALADLAEEWQTRQAGESLVWLRSDRVEDEAPGETARFWERQVQAVELIVEVQRRISARGLTGRRTEHYAVLLARYHAWVFAANLPERWNDANGSPIALIADSDIAQMRSLADFIDLQDEDGVPLSAWVDSMTVAIEEVERVLIEAPSIVQTDYMRALLEEVRASVVDAGYVGAARSRRVSQELAGVLFGEGLRVGPGLKGADRAWLDKFATAAARVAWLAVGAGVSETGTAIGDFVRRALGD